MVCPKPWWPQCNCEIHMFIKILILYSIISHLSICKHLGLKHVFDQPKRLKFWHVDTWSIAAKGTNWSSIAPVDRSPPWPQLWQKHQEWRPSPWWSDAKATETFWNQEIWNLTILHCFTFDSDWSSTVPSSTFQVRELSTSTGSTQ